MLKRMSPMEANIVKTLSLKCVNHALQIILEKNLDVRNVLGKLGWCLV